MRLGWLVVSGSLLLLFRVESLLPSRLAFRRSSQQLLHRHHDRAPSSSSSSLQEESAAENDNNELQLFGERLQRFDCYDDIQASLAQAGLSLASLFLICQSLDSKTVAAMLMQDFEMSPLVAHSIRAAMGLQRKETSTTAATAGSAVVVERNDDDKRNDEDQQLEAATDSSSTIRRRQHPHAYKSVVVNEAARARKQKEDYGLPRNYAARYPKLAAELDSFVKFMTQPWPGSQEDPIRLATANVYLRHAKLFCGWFVNTRDVDDSCTSLSLFEMIPTKERESTRCIMDFVMWLRTDRFISHSYEANLLRGLTKLLKFRFAQESVVRSGDKAYSDIPAISELRRLHRMVNKQSQKAPRSSNEDRKWLSWPEFLTVVESARLYAQQLEDESAPARKIAIARQKHLVLALFSNIPDRQRTIRELEIGRSFVKERGVWFVRHAPDDYKTGKTYGERPKLQVPAGLTPTIDSFLALWRPVLLKESQRHDYLFVQPRSGQPLTQDSVYQIVSRTCFEYTGKKTNPHLLRDSIVTHVRESNASEKELEALALFMGHSVQMQRTSYDRRTLATKVAPAIELLESINKSGETENSTQSTSVL